MPESMIRIRVRVPRIRLISVKFLVDENARALYIIGSWHVVARARRESRDKSRR